MPRSAPCSFARGTASRSELAPADVVSLTPPVGRSVYVLAKCQTPPPAGAIHREYRDRIAGARRSIDLGERLFLPRHRHPPSPLLGAAARGVRVRILLPEVKARRRRACSSSSRRCSTSSSATAWRIYAGPAADAPFEKLAIIDGEFVTVGSYNLDEGLGEEPRSKPRRRGPRVRGARDGLRSMKTSRRRSGSTASRGRSGSIVRRGARSGWR